ncbi:DoxX family protein [Kibdelosporangium aridum]|uniref:DoxX family protein n=1 Tax=Kibdelosporangium aridum TaxID=2030 RepID=UPI000524B8F6
MIYVTNAGPRLLSVCRIVISFLFLSHGVAKMFGVLGTRTVAFGVWPHWYAAVIEIIGGTALLLGIGTRIVSILLSGEMAFAYFTMFQSRALFPLENGGELPALYCWVFLMIAAVGPGVWSVDAVRARARKA